MAKPTIRQATTQHSVLTHGVDYWRKTKSGVAARYNKRTLCGRMIVDSSSDAFDPTEREACGRCGASVSRRRRDESR